MPGRHSRRPSLWWYGLVVGLVIAVAVSSVPVSTFSVGEVSRESSVPVASDEQSILSLEIYDVSAGETQTLVGVTNYVERPVTVTVSLTGKSQEYGTLVYNGSETGDTATFDLNATEGETVSMRVPCDSSLADETVTFDVHAEGNGFQGTVNRRTQIDTGGCGGSRLVYVEPSSGRLHSVTSSTNPRAYDVTSASVIGPQKANFDGDSALEIPYVNGTGALKLVDKNNETQTLVTSGVRESKSLVWVGSWNGTSTAVYYASSDKNIRRVRPGHDSTLVSKDAKAKAIAGAANIDSDASKELVYLDGSANVDYLTGEGETEKTGRGVGSNTGYGIGVPADFDGDGVARIPIVTGSNNVALIDVDGTRTKLGGSAEKTTVAPYDWDGDGDLEIVFLDKSSHRLKIVDGLADGAGSVTIETATDGDGDEITAKPGPGVA